MPSPSAGSSASAAPAKSLSGLGIDPQKWAKSTTVTTEQINGVAIYHVVAVADTAKIMGDVVKAAERARPLKGWPAAARRG